MARHIPAMPEPSRPIVYYDGACPLCRREIGLYRACRGAETIDWVDVAGVERPAADLDRAGALARFHVRTGDGRLVSGAAAFLALWRSLPGWRPAAVLLSVPPLPWLLERFYRLFLRVRPAIARRLPP